MMPFELYPDLKEAYWLSQDLRAIFNKKSTKDNARLNLARWYNRIADSGFKSFNTITATFYEHADEIFNFYDNRSTNASTTSTLKHRFITMRRNLGSRCIDTMSKLSTTIWKDCL